MEGRYGGFFFICLIDSCNVDIVFKCFGFFFILKDFFFVVFKFSVKFSFFLVLLLINL